MPAITLVRDGRPLEVAEGANLREALLGSGVEVYRAVDAFVNCRGNGLCGTCIVEVEPAGDDNQCREQNTIDYRTWQEQSYQ